MATAVEVCDMDRRIGDWNRWTPERIYVHRKTGTVYIGEILMGGGDTIICRTAFGDGRDTFSERELELISFWCMECRLVVYRKWPIFYFSPDQINRPCPGCGKELCH